MCPYFQTMLHRLFLRHACMPFIEPFFTAEAPVDRLLAILSEIVHNPCRHEDVAVPAILIFEDIMRMHITPRWNDVVLFEQCMQVHPDPLWCVNQESAFSEAQCSKPMRSREYRPILAENMHHTRRKAGM